VGEAPLPILALLPAERPEVHRLPIHPRRRARLESRRLEAEIANCSASTTHGESPARPAGMARSRPILMLPRRKVPAVRTTQRAWNSLPSARTAPSTRSPRSTSLWTIP
jgi:hypothetical protein